MRPSQTLTRGLFGRAWLLAALLPATETGCELSAAEVVGWGRAAQIEIPEGLSNVVSIAAGSQHSLALRSDGTVAVWGDNSYGQTNVPSGLSNVVAIAAGAGHNLALLGNGTVLPWGAVPDVLPGLSNVVAVSAGINHSLALRADGGVVAWGGPNIYGQTNVPPGLSNVIAIAAGGSHNIALLANGHVVAWGDNFHRQTNVPSGLSNVVAVAAGDYHSLALRRDGTVAAWGLNNYGQSYVPSGLSNVVAITSRYEHNAALRTDGTVVCWGYGVDGQTQVPSTISSAVGVAAGAYHTIALMGATPGTAPPQLVGPRRLVATVERPFFHRILAKNGVTSYDAEGLPPGLVLHRSTGMITGEPTEGGVFNVILSLANETGVSLCDITLFVNLLLPAVADELVLAGIGSGFNYTVIAANTTHLEVFGLPPGLRFDLISRLISGAPAVLGDFPVSVAASNRYGASSGTLLIRVSPVVAWGWRQVGYTNALRGLSNVVAASAGVNHVLCLRPDGSVTAWGDNLHGQIALPADLSNVVAVSGGYWSSIVLLADGTVTGWGEWYAKPPSNVNTV